MDRWFVKCKTCKALLADEDSSFRYDPEHSEWRSPQWKSVIKCPQCHAVHEYNPDDLERGPDETGI
jgi:hypothetical protein